MIIGITGGSGSGKTAFIRELRSRFDHDQLAVVSEDNYYRPRQEQVADERGILNFDIPEAINEEALLSDIVRLRNGQEVVRTEYTFNNDQLRPREIFTKAAPVIVVEGLFILHRKEIRTMMDLSILIHARDELKLIRRIHRDQEERNYPLEDVLYRYQYHVAPAYQKYIAPYLEEIDLTINNNNHFRTGVDLLTSYIRQFGLK